MSLIKPTMKESHEHIRCFHKCIAVNMSFKKIEKEREVESYIPYVIVCAVSGHFCSVSNLIHI